MFSFVIEFILIYMKMFFYVWKIIFIINFYEYYLGFLSVWFEILCWVMMEICIFINFYIMYESEIVKCEYCIVCIIDILKKWSYK